MMRKKSKQQDRTLKQLLELTKRTYVKESFSFLGKKLAKLAARQNKASRTADMQEQDSVNSAFEQWGKELEDLQEENKGLKKPMPLNFEPEEKPVIEQEQGTATEQLEQNKDASTSQKKAAKAMKQLAQKMDQQMGGMQQQEMEEDADMLRQILDNLVYYSFEEEDLKEEVKTLSGSEPDYGQRLVRQQELYEIFEVVDDSLFALASRNA
jgi:hypothetical protein